MSVQRPIYAGIICAAVMLITAADAASNTPSQSPLFRPLESIKKDLSRTLKCTWGNEKYGTCSGERYPYVRARHLYSSSDGAPIIHLEPELRDYEPLIGRRGEPDPADVDSAELQQQNAIEAIAALFPAWKDSRRWLDEAITRSHEDGFQTSIRVYDTSIYVRFAERGFGHSPEYAYIVLTTEKDLNGFKANQCTDDDQGLAAEGCGPDDGFIPKDPRPMDNPILHPQ